MLTNEEAAYTSSLTSCRPAKIVTNDLSGVRSEKAEIDYSGSENWSGGEKRVGQQPEAAVVRRLPHQERPSGTQSNKGFLMVCRRSFCFSTR